MIHNVDNFRFKWIKINNTLNIYFINNSSMEESSKTLTFQKKKIDQLINAINDVIIQVEEFCPEKNKKVEFQIVCCLIEARNILDEMKFESIYEVE